MYQTADKVTYPTLTGGQCVKLWENGVELNQPWFVGGGRYHAVFFKDVGADVYTIEGSNFPGEWFSIIPGIDAAYVATQQTTQIRDTVLFEIRVTRTAGNGTSSLIVLQSQQ